MVAKRHARNASAFAHLSVQVRLGNCVERRDCERIAPGFSQRSVKGGDPKFPAQSLNVGDSARGVKSPFPRERMRQFLTDEDIIVRPFVLAEVSQRLSDVVVHRPSRGLPFFVSFAVTMLRRNST